MNNLSIYLKEVDTIKGIQIIELDSIGSKTNGYLSFFEGENELGFNIERVYFIYGVPKDVVRGGHAHKSLKQYIWCPYGSVKLILDNGESRKSIFLDSPNKGVIIKGVIWRELFWVKEDSIICVAASDIYSDEDYLKDYSSFKKYILKGRKYE